MRDTSNSFRSGNGMWKAMPAFFFSAINYGRWSYKYQVCDSYGNKQEDVGLLGWDR
jgi:hypothetical protein